MLQCGFQQGRCAEETLINVTASIYSSFNDGNKTTGLFTDFRKAFHVVHYPTLIDTSAKSGVRGVTLSWFEKFLTNRTQRVRAILSGVPQGDLVPYPYQ